MIAASVIGVLQEVFCFVLFFTKNLNISFSYLDPNHNKQCPNSIQTNKTKKFFFPILFCFVCFVISFYFVCFRLKAKIGNRKTKLHQGNKQHPKNLITNLTLSEWVSEMCEKVSSLYHHMSEWCNMYHFFVCWSNQIFDHNKWWIQIELKKKSKIDDKNW